MPDDGTISLAEAFASSATELDSAGSNDTDTPLPGVEVDVTSAANTPDAQDEGTLDEAQSDEDALDLEGFDDLFAPDEGEAKVDVSAPEFLETQVTIDTVNGPETLTIAELQKGYLRQADYTKKTQAVAAQTRAAEEAVEFYQTFKADPEEFARTIAVRAGFIEEGATPVKEIEVAKLQTPEEMEALIEQRVQERLAEAPEVREAKLIAARNAVGKVFEGIEADFKVALSKEQRELVIKNAADRGTSDLRLVFEAMLGKLNAQRSRRGTAPVRPGGPATTGAEGEQPKKVASLREAFLGAEADLAGV